MSIKVEITDKEHPHCGAIGHIQMDDHGKVEVILIGGQRMARVVFDDYSNRGMGGCYACPDELKMLI
jgi:hypothetical protein